MLSPGVKTPELMDLNDLGSQEIYFMSSDYEDRLSVIPQSPVSTESKAIANKRRLKL